MRKGEGVEIVANMIPTQVGCGAQCTSSTERFASSDEHHLGTTESQMEHMEGAGGYSMLVTIPP